MKTVHIFQLIRMKFNRNHFLSDAFWCQCEIASGLFVCVDCSGEDVLISLLASETKIPFTEEQKVQLKCLPVKFDCERLIQARSINCEATIC